MALNSPLWAHAPYSTNADFSAVASTASESSLLSGQNLQPYIPPNFFDTQTGIGRRLRLRAAGVFSNTGTPTLIFQVRSSTTVGATTLSGASLGVSAAITTSSGVTNALWSLWLEIACKTSGQGTNNTTLTCHGGVFSPTGFASPFYYSLEPTTPPTATWTATIDSTLEQFLNLSVTWSASSGSNTITCKDLCMESLN